MKAGGILPKSSNSRRIEQVRGVPDYEIDQIQPKRNKFVVCVFVINEGERVQAQLEQMKKFSSVIDIVVADGGSIDGSLELKFLESVNITALLTKVGPGKLSAQMRMAFHYALSSGYAGVITIDGNGKDGVNSLPDFVELLEAEFDHIQGSRYVEGGHHENTPFSRHIALKLLHAPLISIASGVKQTDTTNGYRAYSSRLLADPEIAVFRDEFQTYELHYHLAIESGRLERFRVIETPVSRVYPKHGKVPTKISPIRGNLHVLGILIRSALGAYRINPKKDLK